TLKTRLPHNVQPGFLDRLKTAAVRPPFFTEKGAQPEGQTHVEEIEAWRALREAPLRSGVETQQDTVLYKKPGPGRGLPGRES
ncbi:hypothetical protein, partial [Evtepia sp.]|uniref:hypothetical protein n=1 Tax=Evtepia sp. TaxID=2773933 RepID=UPI003F1509B2